MTSNESVPSVGVSQYAVEITHRSSKIAGALGQNTLDNMLYNHGLSDISDDELAAISGCLHGLNPIGYRGDGEPHTPDHILRTRISMTEVRDDATERDHRLFGFKSALHRMEQESRERNGVGMFRKPVTAG